MPKTAALSDEAMVSVAEHAMEQSGHAGRSWHVPKMHADDPARREAHKPVNDFVRGVLAQHGYEHAEGIHVSPSHWDLREPGSGQAMVNGMGTIGLKGEHTNDMTLLHECAHILSRTPEGPGGHGPDFQDTAHRLYHEHISPQAADTFGGVMSMRPKQARTTPHERVFGRTYGFDHRLWEADGEHLKPDVRRYIMGTMAAWWGPIYQDWSAWAKVYFAGSEASQWTGPQFEGNDDFDVLVGVDYAGFRKANPAFRGWSTKKITDMFNQGFRAHNGLVHITVDGQPEGPFDRTTYVNPDSYDIRKIKPYAAFDVGSDVWVVKPPELPEWSAASLPVAVLRALRAAETYARGILKLPEPQRTQQGASLFDSWHSDRSRAFSERGEGWYDFANLREKWLDQQGVWAKLVQCRHDADKGLDLARADWSNMPVFAKHASAATDALDEVGRQEHPNVEHYQSGGMGHLEGDESRSVVGFMPTHEMHRYREHAGDWNPNSDERVDKIRQDIRAGVGIKTPLMVEYNPDEHWGYLGEGNHRLRAATEEGLKTVPVRVVRSYGAPAARKQKGIGAPMHLQGQFDRDPNYTPSDIHPHHFIREAVTDRWPPHLTEREDEYGDKYPVNESRHNPRGPVGTESDARAAGLAGPYWHGTSKRRAADILRGGFRQPRMHNWEMHGAGNAEEVDLGHTHRTFFTEKPEDALHFAQAHHGDDAAVVKAYLHPAHMSTEEGGGWMPSVQVKDVAHAVAIREPKTAAVSPRGDRAYGKQDLHHLFPVDEDGPAPRAPAPWEAAGRRKEVGDYDHEVVRRALSAPHEHEPEEVDPRTLHATQPSITRAGVSHYLGDEYRTTGRTFADQHNPGNARPIIYKREDGQNLILSGHHRAAAALLKGEPLQAVVVHGPFGPNRKTGALDPDQVQHIEPEDFATNFHDAVSGTPHQHHVSFHGPEEIREHQMIPLAANGGKTGVLVHDHGDGRVEATGLYNRSETKGAGIDMLKHAIAHHGVNYAECYGPRLPKLYSALGFKTKEQHPFDNEMAHPDWDHGQFDSPDYHVMHLEGRKMAALDLGEQHWDDPEWVAGLRMRVDAELLAEHGPQWMRENAQYADADWQAALAQLGIG